MKREAEKKNAKNVSNSNSEKITLSAADLAKKPIGVRRKSTKPLEIDSGDSKYKGGLDSRLLVRKKAGEKILAQFPWKRESKAEDEYTFGPSPKTKKFLKQRRSASQKNMSSDSFGVHGKIMLEALQIPENRRSIYSATQKVPPKFKFCM